MGLSAVLAASQGLSGHPQNRQQEWEAARRGTVGETLVLSLRTSSTAAACTNAALNSAVFTASDSVNAYYQEHSFGRISLKGAVSGPYVVTVDNRCDRVGWADAADAAALQAGVKLADYAYKLYIEPDESASICPNEGTSQRAEGSPRRSSWVRGDHCDSRLVIAHELGHNVLGAPHASSPTAVYGDGSTVMGLAPVINPLIPGNWQDTPHFNAPGKILMGWVPAGNVLRVAKPGTYRLALLETATTSVQVLKVQGGSTGYYLSYRRPVGFDKSLLTWYAERTSIHLWNGADEGYLLSTIGDGQSFTDASGFSVTQTSHDTTYASLAVSFQRQSSTKEPR
jgi:hypothetical protein